MDSSSDKASGPAVLHIAFCINEPYVPYMLVAARGIIDNNAHKAHITVHILTDALSPAARKAVDDEFAGAAGVDYIIHIVDDSLLNGLIVRHYTKYSWYRMLLPDLLPDVHRILYLDTDIAVAADLSDLLSVDLSGFAVAAAHDTDSFLDEPFLRCGYPKELGYICSGVMLINLDFWRENDIARKVIDWGRRNSDILVYPDQDSINYVCRHHKTYLPLRYGITKSLFTQPFFYCREFRQELLDCLDSPAVVHYAGCAPWFRESEHPMVHIWEEYNSRTRYPAIRRYRTKGFLGWKIRLFDLLHPHFSRAAISLDRVRERIDSIPT